MSLVMRLGDKVYSDKLSLISRGEDNVTGELVDKEVYSFTGEESTWYVAIVGKDTSTNKAVFNLLKGMLEGKDVFRELDDETGLYLSVLGSVLGERELMLMSRDYTLVFRVGEDGMLGLFDMVYGNKDTDNVVCIPASLQPVMDMLRIDGMSVNDIYKVMSSTYIGISDTCDTLTIEE